MSVRNTCFGGSTNWTSEALLSPDLNDTFTATFDCNKGVANSVVSYSLENAMNIAKLQYSTSITDITHDYMAVDVMTDSTGYNNTVSSTLSTSCYNSSGLTGFYDNQYLKLVCPSITYCCRLGSYTTGFAISFTNYGITATACSDAGSVASTCVCSGDLFCTSNIKSICFSALCCGNLTGGAPACTANRQLLICITNSNDNYSTSYNVTTNVNISTVNNYEYRCLSPNTFCFYKNSVGVCQTTINLFPNIILCTCLLTSTNPSVTGIVKVCYYNICILCDASKIRTVPLNYVTSVNTVYMDTDKTGSGTVVYNVYNSNNTSTALSTSLTLGCLHTITSSTSHVYEIVQCNDAVSCIKSYAVAVGV